jgi:hypothetical protein
MPAALRDRFAQPPEADRLDSDTTEPDFTPQEEAVMSPTQHEVQEVAANLQTLPEKEPQPASTPAQPIVFEPTAHQPKQPKRSKTRYRELRVNLADLSAAADRLGIDTTSRTGYQALLDRLLLAIPSALTQQVTPDPNQLLAPLLQELAAIKQQVSVAQQAEELEQLRQQTEQQQHEIDRLHTELQSAHDRLAQIAAAAQGLANVQPMPIPQPAPIQQPTEPIEPTPTSQTPAQQPVLSHRSALGRPSFGKLSPPDRVPIAISALIHHNQNCPPNDRWFLSGNVIATAAGANPALVVTPWLQAHPAATAHIDQHNAAIGLNARSNGKDKDRSQLKTIYQQFMADKSPQELQQIINQFEQQPDAII